MLNLNKHTQTKPKPKVTLNFQELLMCVRVIVHNCRTQHSTEQF